MIGPSSNNGNVSNHDTIVNGQGGRSSKRKIYEDLDVNSFCEELWQNGRKRYLQELETPIELIMSNDLISDDNNTSFFTTNNSTISQDNNNDERSSSVTRLKVLVVDGTNYSWTTLSDLESQRHANSDIIYTDLRTIDDTQNNYQQVIRNGLWEPVNHHHHHHHHHHQSLITLPTSNNKIKSQQNSIQSLTNNNDNQQQQQQPQQQQQQQQQQQYHQFDDQEENGNLSWLLDFKLDPFIEAAADDKIYNNGIDLKDNYSGNKSKGNNNHRGNGSMIYTIDSKKLYNNNQDNSTITNQKSSYVNSDTNNHHQDFSEHFPYYKSNDDRWKNSVRHNLSINPHFRKGSKAPHGAGHLWAIANRSDTRPHQIITTDPTKSLSRSIIKDVDYGNSRRHDTTNSEIGLLDEIEAATASITRQSSEEDTDDIVNSTTLEHCAEQILSGIKKEVEVQYLVPMMVSNGTCQGTQQQNTTQTTNFDCTIKESDFLNPISKEVVAEECGLISEGFLVTDMGSTGLGLNMVESEIISPENLFGEELNFQFYELSSPSQLQSA
ncbi:hypothetical protein HZH68_017050 [Vespula germanica]|uniref:Fork-head domain-containing protein n=1 Tax=Vespula germanica TaxID=30212 RepID=A0A834MNC0_VESGE|nr:hypothetical protein HZH68_017050 [Vespula germanica]